MTTKQKLTKSFRELRKSGYFARQNFKCCQSCAWAAISEGVSEKAVFYHSQDNSDFIKGGNLYLAWSGDGQYICDTLKNNGLEVDWDGNENKRIIVINN